MDVITAAILAIAIPFVFAAIAPALSKASPKLQGWFATVGILISAVLVAWITPAVLRAKGPIVASYAWIPQAGVHFALYLDPLGILLALIASGFGFLALLYSVDDMEHEHGLGRYYMWMLMFIGSMVGLVLAGDLLLLFVFWEMTSLTSYGLIGFYKERREDVSAALKAFVLTHVGGIFLLFGIFIAYLNTGTFLFSDIAAKGFPIGKEFWAGVAIASFLIGAIAKSVQFPMHNWLPSATVAPSAVTALLHAAAMVKAGVYLVARMYTLFPEFMAASWYLVVVLIGAVTMVVGVMNALVQTDLKRLLAYHTISQIGYMITALGLGTTLGIAAGLFHCLNHAVFKGCLFLCAGALIYATGSRSLDDYGGLAKNMPVTAFALIVAAASISGIPPFNGFVSKWLIYSAAIDAGYAWAAVVAMFVSAMTLASFVKVVHSTLFGPQPKRLKDVKEVPLTMQATLIVLALACIIFGIVPKLPLMIIGSAAAALVPGGITATYFGVITEIGIWVPTVATLLIMVGMVVGVLLYYAGMRAAPEKPSAEKKLPFIGGEDIDPDEMIFSSHHMFTAVKSSLKPFYGFAGRGGMDFVDYGFAGVIERTCDAFRKTHTGTLRMYVLWCLITLVVLASVLLWWS